MGWTVRDSDPGRENIFYTSYKRPERLGGPPNGHREPFLGVKRSRREAGAGAVGENEWRYTSSPSICLRVVRRESYLLSFDNSKQSNEIHKKIDNSLTHSPVVQHHKLYALKM
jgi:hypothetical protein